MNDHKILVQRQAIIRKVLNCADSEKLKAINDILNKQQARMTLAEKQAQAPDRYRTYEGFGEEHTNAEWARRLGIPRNTLWRNLQKGLTVEQIVKMKRLEYPPKE